MCPLTRLWVVISIKSSRYCTYAILPFSFSFSFCIVLNFGFPSQVLGESLHITSEYLTHEAKIASAVSRVEVLEAKNSKLKKDIIVVMDETNTIKEKAKVLGDDLRVERQLTLEKDE